MLTSVGVRAGCCDSCSRVPDEGTLSECRTVLWLGVWVGAVARWVSRHHEDAPPVLRTHGTVHRASDSDTVRSTPRRATKLTLECECVFSDDFQLMQSFVENIMSRCDPVLRYNG
jgi:hypothetical protein